MSLQEFISNTGYLSNVAQRQVCNKINPMSSNSKLSNGSVWNYTFDEKKLSEQPTVSD